MITSDQIYLLSKRYTIDEFSIMREYIQIIFLTELFAQKSSDRLFFKGGTALRLLYNSFRFSEDLDFTSLITEEKQLILLLEKSTKEAELQVPGISLRKIQTENTGLSGFLQYKSDELKYPLNIHLDFSFREKPLTSRESILETLFPISSYPLIRHLEAEEILAEKVRALVTRTKGRDFFDMWFLLSKQIPLNWKMIEQKMQYYDKTISRNDVQKKIQATDIKKITQDLGKFLPLSQRKIVGSLKESLLEKLRLQT
jgi:predicted nucleotidyltransferase component of viral defense system